jgi:glycosyltransferase involved in cell wall biosynthesis
MINSMPRHLIASSVQTAEHVQVHSGISKSSVTSVGDGVDLGLFFPRPPDHDLRESLGITANDRVVVFVGVLTPYQGIDLLLEAAQSVRDAIANVKFLVVGFPEQSYRERAQAMGLASATVFTGKVAYAETPRYIALGHMAVSAKISTTEANLKLYSYMAMGLPSVVFDSSVNREILGDLGVYAKYGDAASLASAIIGLLKDEQRAAALGQASFEKAHRCYSWQAIGERLLDLYEQYCAAVSQKESGRLV